MEYTWQTNPSRTDYDQYDEKWNNLRVNLNLDLYGKSHLEILHKYPEIIESEYYLRQLWKYDDSTKVLKNFVSDWKYIDDHWSIPSKEESGKIEEITSRQVLGHRNDIDVILETRKDSHHQIWIRGKASIAGYFTLKNKATNQFLTNWNHLGTEPIVLGGLPDGFSAWYKKAYKNETEVVERSSLMCNMTYFNVYLVWMKFFFKFALPTIVLIGCNIKILKEVRRINEMSASLANKRKTVKQKAKEARLTTMISLIVAIFIVCNSFESLMFIFDSLGLIPRNIVEDFLRPFADFLIIVNSSMNVVIYNIFNESFRKLFCKLYLPCLSAKESNAMTLSESANPRKKTATTISTQQTTAMNNSKVQMDETKF